MLTKDGYIYQVNISEADPFRFPISSNSLGLVDGMRNPIYKSWFEPDYIRTGVVSNWQPDQVYLYEPQARDIGVLINNKVFFNPPDPNMPTSASVTDIFREDPHATWLYNELEILEIEDFYLTGQGAGGNPCQPGSLEFGQGGNFIFETNLGGVVTLQLDLDNNGDFTDPVDVTLQRAINQGIDQVYWDGNDGLGNPIPPQQGFTFNYQGSIKFGELHIALQDVEAIYGGVTFKWLNAPPSFSDDQFYYDHSDIGGPVSGGGSPGNALPTNTPYIYPFKVGDDDYIDHWMLASTPIPPGSITVDIAPLCFTNPNNEVENVAEDFVRPVDLAHCGDERLFVAERGGKIWFLDAAGDPSPSPFLDLTNIIGQHPVEMGLLGMTFHPDYQNNGYFYVHHTERVGDTYFSKIVRYSVSPSDPNMADPNSGLVILEKGQPFDDNNGGCLRFGPDGYLYIGFGDGGSEGDILKNAQNPNTVLGKMLRIDVDNGMPYTVPANNPFVNDPNVLDEIWAIGLRNPWRFSFDHATGDLWIGDEGQHSWEEIDRQPSTSTAAKTTAGAATRVLMITTRRPVPHKTP